MLLVHVVSISVAVVVKHFPLVGIPGDRGMSYSTSSNGRDNCLKNEYVKTKSPQYTQIP